MAKSPQDQVAKGADAPRTLIEAAYQKVRADIVSGDLAPGEKLRVEHLKDRYEVGAGTLREALSRLASETLVIAQGQRGFRVAPLSLADFEDITRTRMLLESQALRLSIQYGDEAWEGEVAGAYHRLSRAEEKLGKRHSGAAFDEWELRNKAFHRSLLAACPSNWTLHFLGILYQQSERYRRFVLEHPPIPRDVHGEHAAIAEATMSRDPDRAARLISEHIELTLEAVRAAPAEAFEPQAAKKPVRGARGRKGKA